MSGDVRIVATYARRDEPDSLVDGLHENLAPWVSDIIPVQVPRTGPWGHEGELRQRQRDLVSKLAPDHRGGVWVLFIDPDERLEDTAATIVPAALAAGARRDVYGFPLREMWTPTAYRVDSGWADKKPRRRLYHLRPGQTFVNKPIHCGIVPTNRVRERVTLPVNLYHLKGIEPGNRVERARAYVDSDPLYQHQRRASQDWSFLYDETGLVLETIPEGRGFSPPYVAGSYVFTAPGYPAETGKDEES